MRATAASTQTLSPYSEFVNPRWEELLELVGMNVRYERCLGAELFTQDGRRILDFLSGYCVQNTGHNHPAIVEALKDELDRCGPAMLQTDVPELAGELARRLCALAGGGLRKAYFCSSGSEGVEAAIKFSRAATGRAGLLYAEGGFHGLTCGALSLMSDPFWRNGFGPMLPGTEAVPFGDLTALEEKLATRRFAGYITEPVQSEAGIRIPPADYFPAVERLCRRYETMLVLDEVQTGMFRTGPFLAAQHFGARPDMVILAKALSGGLIPSGAVLMTDEIYDAVYSSLRRAIVHTSTFSENGLAMRAGLATLEVLEREGLGQRATEVGAELRRQLSEQLAPFEMVKDVRGVGLLCGIEFTAPRGLGLRVPFEAFRKIHPAMFGQCVVMRMFRDRGILTQICGNNFLVLKVAPPLIVSTEQVAEFVAGVRDTMAFVHSAGGFWTEALQLARRSMRI
jgi:ornithine--oxo-acid transaminase